jgi:hypothetical protein
MAFWAAATAFAKTPIGGKVVSGILGGISSLFGGKSKRKQAEQEHKNNMALAKEQAKQQGEEQRKTSRYEMEMASAVDEYGRARKRGALKNFGYASENDPYAQTALQGYERQWSPEDTKLNLPGVPGATPTTPAPVVSAVPRR